MTKAKQNDFPGGSEQSIEAIRQIIFGEKERDFEQRFQQLEQQIQALRQEAQGWVEELKKQLEGEKERLSQWIGELKGSLEQQGTDVLATIEKLRQEMEQRLNALTDAKADRKLLSDHFRQLAQLLHGSTDTSDNG
jgi:methyl-accepting chemotaxis protein